MRSLVSHQAKGPLGARCVAIGHRVWRPPTSLTTAPKARSPTQCYNHNNFGRLMSALGSKADIGRPPIDVRFTPKSGHWNSVVECLLCAKSGHWPGYPTTSRAFPSQQNRPCGPIGVGKLARHVCNAGTNAKCRVLSSGCVKRRTGM